MLKKIVKLLGFTLIELLVVMVISSILGAISVTGYMKTLRIHRRQDAILSMQKALLNIQITEDAVCPDPVAPGASILYKDTTTQNNCFSSNEFYHIHYNKSGYTIADQNILNSMGQYELIILKATPTPGKSQDKDTGCDQQIYLSNENKIYPANCVN